MRVLAVASAAILLTPTAAAGGGWWTSIRLDRETVGVGHEVKAYANVMFSPVDAIEAEQSGRAQDEPFYVYLLSGFDYRIVEGAMRKASPRDWWSIGDAEAIRVGRVALGTRNSNLALASATFRIPDVPPGRYSVMFCSAGCARPLADVIPTLPSQLTVVAAPAESSGWAKAGWFFAGALAGAFLALALTVRRRKAARPTIPHTAVRALPPRSSSRGGRSPGRRRRSGARSSRRA
jgi:hypothetical protein